MKKKLTLDDFRSQALDRKEARKTTGGRNYIPSTSGSFGYINWDDVDIRNEGFTPQPTSSFSLLNTKLKFGG
ncbi:MAG: hypothetical protein CMN32_02070 [Saprospirales bacterium]|jgi:hypothetical protein|nr:hypothetical protein [Saprospirales bacterium]